MSFAFPVAIAAAAFLLGLVTFVQLLYLESLRLRTRDLPAMRFFKDTLEGRVGIRSEDAAGAFSLIKHSLLVVLGVLYFAAIVRGGPWNWREALQAAGAAWGTMLLVAYAIPQILYRRTEARWLLPLAPLLKALALAARPFSAGLSLVQSLADLADEKKAAEEPPTSAENIEALISAGAEEGLIEEDDRQLIQSVVEFGDKLVREVMTPRPNMVAIAADSALEELRQLVIQEQYSRIPVYEDGIDNIRGFVHVRDMFELDEEQREHRGVRDLMRAIRFVPETKPVNDLMREMQQEGAHMVVVVDEYGNTAGLATMEDLVEVILGEIRDEHEPASDVTEEAPGVYVVSGNFDLARLAGLVSFRANGDIESTTVGGLVTEWLGRVPQAGEAVERHGIRIEVLASDELRVTRVRISRAQPVPRATPQA